MDEQDEGEESVFAVDPLPPTRSLVEMEQEVMSREREGEQQQKLYYRLPSDLSFDERRRVETNLRLKQQQQHEQQEQRQRRRRRRRAPSSSKRAKYTNVCCHCEKTKYMFEVRNQSCI